MQIVVAHDELIVGFTKAKELTQTALKRYEQMFGGKPIGVRVNTSCRAVMVDVMKQLELPTSLFGSPYVPKNQHWLRIRPKGFKIFKSRIVEQDPTQAVLTLLETRGFPIDTGQIVFIAPRHKANMEHGQSKHAIIKTIEIKRKGVWIVARLDPEVLPDEIWVPEVNTEETVQ